ncbi:hypothetical protein CDL12_18246 [Handroanthus impetiginosus]|uniref:Uncharacterized protein n=1 Tax=Handroanthus impetiginosus TaxID=429701 RepID=A0A2G9GV84_9LAMI|nr:hypothetical protein CDL12_18246 [Handroanthus impetiginosus]
MPKDRRERSLSLDRSRLSPYPCSSGCSRQSLPKNPLEDDENIKQWEDARCPICMEHPHNAILLLCSSHEKGCRPFMCDTSYRHSNCFDQFRKAFGDASGELQRPEDMPNLTSSLDPDSATSGEAVSNIEGERSLEGSTSMPAVPFANPAKLKLVCPLCRGLINGWTVVQSARRYMNAKSRNCACETCDYSGTYTDLRKHARLMHAFVRPTDADPERQRNWRRLERQRDLGDLLSTLQSSVGDEMTGESTLTIDEGGWLTVFFLVRFIRPDNVPSRSSTSRARNRSSGRLWGETDDGNLESRGDEDESSDHGIFRRHYVRRRLRDPENR